MENLLEVRARGRLDGYWADHLSKALEEIICQGNHHIVLNLSEVNYVSSMGIRVLVAFYQKLSAIEGSFSISEPSANVRELLKMVKLDAMLMPAAPKAPAAASSVETARQIEGKNARFEIFDLATNGAAGLKCRIVGNSSLLKGCRFVESNCHALAFPKSTCAVGLDG